MKKALLVIPVLALALSGCTGSAPGPDEKPSKAPAPAASLTKPTDPKEKACFDADLKEVREHIESKTWHKPEECKGFTEDYFTGIHELVLLHYAAEKK